MRSNGKAIHLVTNSHPAGIAIKFQQIKIEHYFDSIISSHEFQQPKEASAFWEALSERIHFEPERTLFIDDNVAILRTAVEFGIEHILGIHQPDSQQPRLLSDVPAIHHFDEIMLGL